MDTKFQSFAISIVLAVVSYFATGWLKIAAIAGVIFFAFLGLKK